MATLAGSSALNSLLKKSLSLGPAHDYKSESPELRSSRLEPIGFTPCALRYSSGSETRKPHGHEVLSTPPCLRNCQWWLIRHTNATAYSRGFQSPLLRSLFGSVRPGDFFAGRNPVSISLAASTVRTQLEIVRDSLSAAFRIAANSSSGTRAKIFGHSACFTP